MQHSRIVGGSTAKRVINCPGSVALVDKMPPQPSSKYADEGTLLHDTIADILDGKGLVSDYLGRKHNDIVLTQDLIDRKLSVALTALMEVDPNLEMEYAVESRVGFGDLCLTCSVLLTFWGALVIGLLCWIGSLAMASPSRRKKTRSFFYAAAAARTPETAWAFEGASEVELVIVQPPSIKRWLTSLDRVKAFEDELVRAVRSRSSRTHRWQRATIAAGVQPSLCVL